MVPVLRDAPISAGGTPVGPAGRGWRPARRAAAAGALGQCQGQRDLGPLTAGELADRLVRRDAELRQPGAGQRRVPPPVQLAASDDQLRHGEVPVQRGVLGDEPDVGQDVRVVVRGPPNTRTVPASGLSRPTARCNSVLLPAPLGPTSAAIRPAGRCSEHSPQRPGAPYRLPNRSVSSDDIHPVSSHSVHAGRFGGVVGEGGPQRRLHQGDDVLGRRPAAGPVSQATRSVRSSVCSGRDARPAWPGRTCPARAGRRQALDLQLPVRLQHRVRVDRQRLRDVPDLRQLVARLEQAHPQRLFHLLHELQVGVHLRPAIQYELDHA